MKNHSFMDCNSIMDAMYESEKVSSMPLVTQMRIKLHLLLCSDCAGELRKLQRLDEIIKTDFFPPSPELEESIMECLFEDTIMEEKTDISAGFSFRGWIVIGFFVLLSLSSSFFGINFTQIADAEGLSFLLPVGITIGIVVTCYGALFIGSHLEELSTRFRLR